MSKLKIVWIDDDPERRRESTNLESRINANVNFISTDAPNEGDLVKSILDLLEEEEPELILMDHSLINAKSKLIKNGSTATFVIHDKWPECPIVCVTGTSREDVDGMHRSVYQEIIPIEKISDFDNTLKAIANGFHELKSNRPENEQDLIEIMRVPITDRERVVKILPNELKGAIDDKSLLLGIYKWIKEDLIEHPGFLYDKLWVSTYLGLTEEGFDIVHSIFDDARYDGVFANKDRARWWKSDVSRILNSQVSETGLPWVIGRKLDGISESHFSKCYVTNEDFPETVAYEDDQENSTRYAMCLKNTIPHPCFESRLFFEDIRMMIAES